MRHKITMTTSMLLWLCSTGYAVNNEIQIMSPQGDLSVAFFLKEGKPMYMVRLDKDTILAESPLGLIRSDGDFTQDLEGINVSDNETISDKYTMLHGKQLKCTYTANRRVITLQNPQKQRMDIVFQVSHDGVAFCYRFPDINDDPKLSVNREITGFAFPDGTTSWLHPLHDAKTGWNKTYPSYESHYEIEKPVGQPSPYSAGWAFPALFRIGQTGWVVLSETNVDETYCACRLAQHSNGGLYRIAFPQAAEHRGEQDPVAPEVTLPFTSPWRIIVAGKTLGSIVESTLASDLATPSRIQDTTFIKPGRAAWSWLRYDTQGTELPKLREYLGLAADLGWEYLLVDADWDRIVGYDNIATLAQEAHAKGIRLILWYNSNGEWNDAPMTPKDKMHLSLVRRAEFERLQQMGINGIKVDFFGGDKQATMQLYMDILKDAAQYHLLCNFHGATLPRGWQRTWPNMVTTEAVMGMEYCTFDQRNANLEAKHCCVLPFTRNVVAPMDFTPVVVDRSIRQVKRVTSPAFELALPVIFESGIQHFGLAPFEARTLLEFTKAYLKAVPTAWDQTRFISGYPAKDVVLARQKGKAWFIAGINGEKKIKTMSLDVSFLGPTLTGSLITDDPDNDTLMLKKLNTVSTKSLEVTLQPYGGFVLQTQ